MIPTSTTPTPTIAESSGQPFVLGPENTVVPSTAHPVSSACATLPDLRLEFESLAKTTPRPAAYLRAVMRKLVSRCRQIGCGLKGRVGAETLSDFACVDALNEEEQTQLRQTVSEVVLAHQGESTVLKHGPYAVGRYQVGLLTIPLPDGQASELVATACFAMAARSTEEFQFRALELQSHLALALQCLSAVVQQSHLKLKEQSELDMVARVGRYRNSREFAFALVNSLASRFACEQVGLGVHRDGGLQVLAISGTDRIKSNSPGIIDLQQAMEEARDARRVVVFQPEGQSLKQKAMPIHIRVGAANQSSICSIPLMAGEHCVAVVTLRRPRRAGFTDALIQEIEKLVMPFGPAIEMSLRSDRTFSESCLAYARQLWPSILRPQTSRGRIARNASLAAVAFLLFGWLPYQPLTPSVLVPSDLTQSIAAFDMQLTDAMANSGDRVKRGQVLARFDTKQLELQRAGLASQYEQAEVDVRRALINGDAAAASLAKANSLVFATQLAAIEEKISQCTITAPDDGMVMNADLNQKRGQIFAQGQPILSFARLNDWHVELRIPESQARFFEVEQDGLFAPTSSPSQRLRYKIESVSGAAELIDGKNVFVARAKIDGQAEYLRLGMEGVASTNTGWKPIIWIALHRVFEYARASFWM